MKKNYIIGGVLIIITLGIMGKAGGSTEQTTNSTPTPTPTVTTESPKPKLEYELINREQGKNDENVSILVKPGESKVREIAEEVQKSCKKQCNVSVYDDRKAYDLDTEYTNKMMSYDVSVAERTSWKEKNTVFLAEHLLATVGYGFGPYTEYPLKDSYYKELKGQN